MRNWFIFCSISLSACFCLWNFSINLSSLVFFFLVFFNLIESTDLKEVTKESSSLSFDFWGLGISLIVPKFQPPCPVEFLKVGFLLIWSPENTFSSELSLFPSNSFESLLFSFDLIFREITQHANFSWELISLIFPNFIYNNLPEFLNCFLQFRGYHSARSTSTIFRQRSMETSGFLLK